MLLRPGLTSITHRQLSPLEVVALASEANLEAIEWGADVHLLPGSPAAARDLAARCRDAGIDCPSYGSYFRVGRDDPTPSTSWHVSRVRLCGRARCLWA